VTTAIKQQAATDEDADAAVQSMMQLNQQAARLAHEVGVHACTDITGFGLLGHATEVAVKSDVAIEIDHSAIPWLPGVDRYAAEGRFPGGANRNRDYYETLPEAGVTFSEGVSAEIQRLLFNPETSGGLLLSVAAERGDALLDAFAKAGHGIWELGTVRDGRGIVVR
jgi:selenide,water dikinase